MCGRDSPIGAENGCHRHAANETRSIETTLARGKGGLGITLVSALATRAPHRRGPRDVSLASEPTRSLVFAYSRLRYLSAAARALLGRRRASVTASAGEGEIR